MTVTLDRDFFLDEKKLNVFCSSLVKHKNIDEAINATSSDAYEPLMYCFSSPEAADIYSVLGKALFLLEKQYKEFPNQGHKDALEFAKIVYAIFGSRKPIGGYPSQAAADKAQERAFATECFENGCD